MTRTKVYVATPTTGTIVDAQTYALREIESRYSDQIEFIYPKQCVRRMFHDFARNSMVEEFLDSAADILWFLDSDIVPPKHVLDLVTLHGDKWKAAGAPYPVFMEPEPDQGLQVVFTVYNGTDGKGLHPAAIPLSGLDFVDGIATGCLFLKREVFKGMIKPYFSFQLNPETRAIEVGEDLDFCKKLNAQGIRFFIDYSMACKHYKTVCLLDVNAYAMMYANRSVMNYEQLMKGQIQKLVAAYAMKKEAAPAPEKKSTLILPGSPFIK